MWPSDDRQTFADALDELVDDWDGLENPDDIIAILRAKADALEKQNAGADQAET